MHISLRTLFLIITAVAIYLAIHVALLQGTGVAGASRSLYAALLLPLFVIWVAAAAWVVQHRRTLAGAHLVLWAIGLNIAGRLATEILQSLGYWLIEASRNSDVAWLLFTLSGVSSAIFATASWTLVLLAFVRANQLQATETVHVEGPASVSNPWEVADGR